MRAAAIYHVLLRCYPAAFRDEYGEQMWLTFAEQLNDARRTGQRLRQTFVWIEAAGDVLTVAPREHAHVLFQDLRYAVRTMAARPGFASVAILSLALGIGANTAIFSLWNGVVRAPLPAVQKPGELVMFTNPDEAGMWRGTWESRTDGPRSWLTYAEFEQLRDHVGGVSAMMATQSSISSWQVRVEGDGRAGWEEARGRLVSGGFFAVLGVPAAIGRVFTADADRVDTDDVVISYKYWQRRFGGRTDVLGKTLTIRSTAVTIIGVAPSGFVGETSSQQPDLWLPLRLQPRVLPGGNWLRDTPPDKAMWLHVFGRLKPGVTAPRAEAEANAVFQSGLEAFYGSAASGERRRELLDQHLQVRSGARGASSRRVAFADSLTALMAAVGVVLLIACANLANLLLARGAARKAEMAVRLSLGAGRGRLVRQLVTESLALAALGGMAAVAVSYVLHQALVNMLAESDTSFRLSFSLDPLVSAFLFTLTLVAGLLFGLLPAWQVTRTDAGATLKDQWRGAVGSRAQLRSGRVLVSLQLALSLPLLVGAALLARTAYNLQRVDLGFAAERLLLVRVDLRAAVPDPARRNVLSDEILGQIRRVPGVTAATFSQLGIFTGSFSNRDIEVEGHVPAGENDRASTIDAVGPGYFSTLGAHITLGRDIREGDSANAPRVSVINEAFAERFFARRNPLGLSIAVTESDESRTTYRVVGVARNTRTDSVRDPIEPRFFVPAGQIPSESGSPTFVIRAQTETASIVPAIRDAIERTGSGLPITSARTVEDRMAPLTAQDRTTARLALAFAAVALTLAAIGLYGVLSYGVARRTSEIAIRIALGAQPRRVITMILGETTLVVAAGLAAGVGLAYAASRLVDSRLYGVAPRDPVTFALATSLLLVVALVAAYLPARRASRLEPTAALRGD
jgi:predicted permease